MANSKRSVPMRVLSLSPSRTGTKSMCDALSILLDEKVYHGYDMMNNRPPGKYWLICAEAKYDGKGKVYGRQELDEGLGEYAGCTDVPGWWFWREMMDAYPDAKVVLVNRDFEKWWPSFEETVLNPCFHPLTWLVVQMEPLLGTWTGTTVRKLTLEYFGVSSRSEITKEKAREVFERHYRDIRQACESTPGRLLEMRIQDGWEPLCRHLEVPIPDVPFPQTNEAGEQQRITTSHRRGQLLKGFGRVGLTVLPAAVVGAAIGWAWFYRR